MTKGKFLIVPIDHQIGITTNSSSEIYVIKTNLSERALKNALNKVANDCNNYYCNPVENVSIYRGIEAARYLVYYLEDFLSHNDFSQILGKFIPPDVKIIWPTWDYGSLGPIESMDGPFPKSLEKFFNKYGDILRKYVTSLAFVEAREDNAYSECTMEEYENKFGAIRFFLG